MLMLAAVLIGNRGILIHADQYGVTALQEDTADFAYDDGGDGVSITIKNSEEGIYIRKLSFAVDNPEEKPASIRLLVTCIENGSEVTGYEYNDLNPIYVERETVLIDRDHVTGITVMTGDAGAGDMDTGAGSGTAEDTGIITTSVIGGTGGSVGNTSAGTGTAVGAAGQLRMFSGFVIDNSFGFNPYIMLFVFASGFAMLLLIVLRDRLAASPAAVYLIIGTAMGFCLLSGLPRNKVGYDEETHLQAVMDMASFPSSELHVSADVMNQMLITEYNNPAAQPGTSEEMYQMDKALAERGNYKTGERTPDFYTLPNRMPAYLPMAAAMKLGKGLGLSWPALLTAARTANLVVFLLLMAAAVYFVPVCRPLMMLIGLFPQCIFLACTISYDPFIIGTLSLGYALLLKGRKYIAPAVVLIILGCLPKAVYAPVVLLGAAAAGTGLLTVKNSMTSTAHSAGQLTAPGTTARESAVPEDAGAHEAPVLSGQCDADIKQGKQGAAGADKKQGISCRPSGYRKYIITAVCIILFAGMAAVFILPTVLAPSETGDLRGGATSELSQVGFILHYPLQYAVILIRQMISWIPQCWLGPDCTVYMGHVVNGAESFKGTGIPYMLLIVLTVMLSWIPASRRGGNSEAPAADNPDACGSYSSTERSRSSTDIYNSLAMKPEIRLFLILCVGMASVLIWTSMYVAFTEPGAQEIAGVQGRYFIPLMFPLYLALSGMYTERGLLESKPAICYYLMDIAELVLLAFNIWTAVISRFCM